ncbi:hypothetical protein GGTG_03692 [Gaeumannomyces tritici R3-111a-1]|uniref:Uncharacterized protein n=1 Tax=Gaeumannomyces tritici (strain R3-111a-1) TaxID=644352 RepID=J3NQY7_GAET3|nr:hypothetical protein GGTG_03692 [Gaeumannomyces tritici R3-111a-1]EJT78593.1 hypothetical protein GGTG_03692 [Gaeumannomyces tritici R3-111a-1]
MMGQGGGIWVAFGGHHPNAPRHYGLRWGGQGPGRKALGARLSDSAIPAVCIRRQAPLHASKATAQDQTLQLSWLPQRYFARLGPIPSNPLILTDQTGPQANPQPGTDADKQKGVGKGPRGRKAARLLVCKEPDRNLIVRALTAEETTPRERGGKGASERERNTPRCARLEIPQPRMPLAH